MYVGVVREFLSETVHSFLGRCDFKRVGASLRAANVISVGEFQRLQACPQLEDANRFLYSLLDGDPSTRKLGALSAALKDDTTHDGHQELAQLIDQFLQGEDIAVGVVIYISNYNLCCEPHLLTTSVLVLHTYILMMYTINVLLKMTQFLSSGQVRHLAISTSPHSDVTPGPSEVSVFT